MKGVNKLFLSFIFAVAAASMFVLASNIPTANAQLSNALPKLKSINEKADLPTSLESTVGGLVKAALSLVGTIFLLLTIYAGILWMTAQGKEDLVEKSQNIIKASIIGLFITLAAYAITAFVAGRLSGVAETTETKALCTPPVGICKTAPGADDVIVTGTHPCDDINGKKATCYSE